MLVFIVFIRKKRFRRGAKAVLDKILSTFYFCSAGFLYLLSNNTFHLGGVCISKNIKNGNNFY